MLEIPPPQRTPPLDAGLEHAQLDSWLDFYRATLIIKCAELTIEQLALRRVEYSELTPLGIVRRMTRVEQCWFEEAFTGREVAAHYSRHDDPDADLHDLASAPLDEVIAHFPEACQRSRELALGRDLGHLTVRAVARDGS